MYGAVDVFMMMIVFKVMKMEVSRLTTQEQRLQSRCHEAPSACTVLLEKHDF